MNSEYIINSRYEAFAILKLITGKLGREVSDIQSGINENLWDLCEKLHESTVADGLITAGIYSMYGDDNILKLLKHLEVSISWSSTYLVYLQKAIEEVKKMELKRGGIK